jgi:hypothetical protein
MSSAFLRFLQRENALGGLLALTAFAVYLTTLAPSIGFIDAGELAAVAHTFGIAHPTGYPLFTLAAGAFSHLPLGGTVIWKLNLFAALCCAASVFVFFRFFLALLRLATPSRAPGFEGRAKGAAATAALTLAFSRTFWAQATSVEVYSLHLLMVALILWLFARAVPGAFFPAPLPRDSKTAKPSADARPGLKALFLFAFALGLGFTNHMTTLLLLPALCVGYFRAHGWKRKEAWRDAGLSLPFFLAGLSLYLYLPLRASTWPEFNWGAIVDFESFFWHVSGRQYSGWMFNSLEPAGRNLAFFVKSWPGESGYAAWILALAGWGWMFLRARRLFVFSLLLFLGCLAYAVNYDIADVVNYFLLAHVATAVAVACGALWLLEKARGSAVRVGAFLVLGACAGLPLALNHAEVDESGNYAVEDYAREVLGSVQPNAVILTYEWDVFVAAAWYLQAVENYRADVLVVDRELLRHAWYLRKLRREHPDFTEGSAAEIEAFKVELRKFDLRLPYDPAVIDAKFKAMILSLLHRAAPARPLYLTTDIEADYFQGFQRLPAGTLMRLYLPGAPPPFFPREFVFRPFPKDNEYYARIRARYATAYTNQALFFAAINELALCRQWLRKALEVDPVHMEARSLLLRLEAGNPGTRAGP